MSDTATDAEQAPAAVEDEAPVTVELNHRGGPAGTAVVHVNGQQVYDVARVELSADAESPDDMVVTLTCLEGQSTTVRVTRLDLVGEVQK